MKTRSTLGSLALVSLVGLQGCVLEQASRPDPVSPQARSDKPAAPGPSAAERETMEAAARRHVAVIDRLPEHSPAPASARGEDPFGLASGDRADAADRDEATRHDDIWTRIEAGFGLPLPDNKRVRSQYEWYAAHTDYLARASERARPYLYLIMEQIEERGLPAELALLPIVESAFQPFAYSHGRAAGIWQFIPSTGRHFGLKQNWWYDGRRDIYASTRAALDYLKQLSERFDGDWMLALASYNAGGGTVSRAIRRNRENGLPTDFWNLRLPNETRAYVPKLIALARLLKERGAAELNLAEIPNEPYLERVNVGSQIDLALAARLAEMDLDDLQHLNPGFNRWATDPTGPHYLMLPRDKVDAFRKELATLPPERRVTWVRHTIEPGETLSEIADDYHVSVSAVMATNDLHRSLIRAGDHLLIPVGGREGQRVAGAADDGDDRIRLVHAVKSGDSLWKIARRYGVSHHDLAHWNELDEDAVLRPGDRLTVWTDGGQSGGTATGGGEASVHVVASGESLWTIARRYDVDHHQLARWNGIGTDAVLQPGQELIVRAGASRPADTPARQQTVRYNVRRGDSLYTIAQRFDVSVDDLRRWNDVDGYIHPGQKLTLHVDVAGG